jgi:pyrroloquinoline quinone biosynthesis protein E
MVRLAREEAAEPPKPFIYRNPRNAAEVVKAEARALVPAE